VSRERAAFADTGVVVSYFETVSAGGDLPQTALVGGANSLINVDGLVVTGGTVAMQPGQRIVGGGTLVPLVGVQTGVRVDFTTPGQRGVIENGSSQPAFALADDALLQNLDILSPNAVAIEGIGVGGVQVTDVMVSTAALLANGLDLNASEVQVNSSTISTASPGARGIEASNGSQVTVVDSHITTAGDFAFGIATFREGQLTLVGSTIVTSGTNADGISSEDTRVTVIDSRINSSGFDADGIQANRDTQLTVIGSHILSSGVAAEGISAFRSGTFLVTDSEVVSQDSQSVGVQLGPFFGETLNATIRDSRLVAIDVARPEILFRADIGTISGNIFGNTLDGGNGEITLDASGGGTINITQLDPAVNDPNSLDEANGIPEANVNEAGTVNYNQPPPPLP
jgi:autotransporter family porin